MMARTGARHEPYLPGSSIKGAIRTAWVWYKAGAGETRPGLAAQAGQVHADIFEAEVLGYRVQLGGGPEATIDTTDPHADPLRSLRIRDAYLVPDSNVIERVMLYEGEGKAAREPMFCDATFSGLEDEPITATGEMTVYNELQAHRVLEGLRSEAGRRWRWPKAVSDEIRPEQILEACRKFYLENLAREHERFYKPNKYLRPIGEKLVSLATQAAGQRDAAADRAVQPFREHDDPAIRRGRQPHAGPGGGPAADGVGEDAVGDGEVTAYLDDWFRTIGRGGTP